MKKLLSLFIVVFLLHSPQAYSLDIPSSVLSKRVIKRVTPKLKAQVEELGFEYGSAVFIRIIKKSSKLQVFLQKGDKFEHFKDYPICYFSGELGPKLKVGDLQSPEGFYFVRPHQLNPYSKFHLSFNLGYPNAYDRANRRTGSALMVHGSCVSIGCYAMTNKGIEEIYSLVVAALQGGQPFFRVHVFPFEMSEANLKAHANSKWAGFWENLKQGYEHFETHRRPPNVLVKNKKYVFELD